ncbi:MAG: sugar kinase [Pirellulales bacterium]
MSANASRQETAAEPSTAGIGRSFEFDVITLGETMLRFTPPEMLRIEQAESFQIHIGGSESNTAVGLARLGKRTAWLSRLPDSPLGRIVEGSLARWGVDTKHVVWSNDDRMGLYFLENASAPRPAQVIYDRRDSAMSRMTPADLPMHLFAPGRAALFHTTGITLAISPSARATAEAAIHAARSAGMRFSFDVNYRAKLWSPRDAADGCESALSTANVIFIPERDARTLYGLSTSLDGHAVLKFIADRFPQSVCVMTCGRLGSRARHGDCEWNQGIYASSEIGRLGGGDSFSAGFLSCWLETEGIDIGLALQWAAATAALKYSVAGDLPIFTRAEVEQLMASGAKSELQR